MSLSVIRLPACPVPDYTPSRRAVLRGPVLAALAGLTLTSCTTFGTNISGKFACGAAQGGTCAPATVIDDKALAEITGETSYRPAGPYQAPARGLAPQQVAYQAPATGGAAVGPQKVLRIVFPAHVDGAGRYHEASIVQAVVDNGQWLAATNGHGPGLTATSTLNVSPEILSQLGAPIDAVSANERATTEQLAADAATPAGAAGATTVGAPTLGAVAAARARAKPADKTVSLVQPPRVAPAATPTPAPQIASKGAVNRPASFSPSVED